MDRNRFEGTAGSSNRDINNNNNRPNPVELALRELRELSGSDSPAPFVLVLVGIPGSGKSTFAKRLCECGWGMRVSQDDMGSRPAVERSVVRCLKNGTNVVVDRCNFDSKQRKHWVDYAHARGSDVGVIVFATPLEECMHRVRNRTNHPTLNGQSEESEGVVMRMANSFVFPNRQEGFLFCRVIRTTQDGDRVLSEILHAR